MELTHEMKEFLGMAGIVLGIGMAIVMLLAM